MSHKVNGYNSKNSVRSKFREWAVFLEGFTILPDDSMARNS